MKVRAKAIFTPEEKKNLELLKLEIKRTQDKMDFVILRNQIEEIVETGKARYLERQKKVTT